jgi:hypothetical protein
MILVKVVKGRSSMSYLNGDGVVNARKTSDPISLEPTTLQGIGEVRSWPPGGYTVYCFLLTALWFNASVPLVNAEQRQLTLRSYAIDL